MTEPEASPPPPLIFTLRRKAETPLSTVGLWDDGGWGPGEVWGLEPGAGGPHPRVLAGDYPLELRPQGGKWEKFRNFLALHELILPGLPHLLMTPDRLALIHPGNTYHDTEACILPGLTRWTKEMTTDGQWAVGNSQAAFVKMYPHLRDAIQSPGGAILRILEEFHPEVQPR